MIPIVGVVALRTQAAGRRWWIPLPVFLLWLVLLPLAVVWLPALVIVSLVLEINPWRVLTISCSCSPACEIFVYSSRSAKSMFI